MLQFLKYFVKRKVRFILLHTHFCVASPFKMLNKTNLTWLNAKTIDEWVVYIDEPAKWKSRILRQIHTADLVGIGQKVLPVHYTVILCTGATFFPYRLGQLYICIRCDILVFHFAGSSLYNSLIYVIWSHSNMRDIVLYVYHVISDVWYMGS